jgi:hypothetical protein
MPTPCEVCREPTRNVVKNSLKPDGVPISLFLCLSCVELIKRERMNEKWIFD